LNSELKSRRYFKRAQRVLVGGVNSPVRSFQGVERENPLFICKASGSKIFDVDGNKYIDYVCSWGASILGSSPPSVVRAVQKAAKYGLSYGAATNGETELAEKIRKHVPSMELMRFVCSGTEATMSAIRVARAFSKKEKILKFDGCYHGHADSFLVRAGSGLATFSIADSAGVPPAVSNQTLVAPFNDIDYVSNLLDSNRGKVAAIIVEPVAGNMGMVPPKKNFLSDLRKIADQYDVLLIFDEVITGFRVSLGGAQALYGVKPDITCLGKVIGGGMNVGAFGGREDIMKLIAPLGPVYQAGTLAGNPIAVSAGIATLSELKPSLFANLDATSENLVSGMKHAAKECEISLSIQRVASMIGIFFDPNSRNIENYHDVKQCSKSRYSKFFSLMISNGIYLPPSPFETIFVSAAHSTNDIDKTIDASRKAFDMIRRK
jgi:glutamate-1-semialdehyde 2,1-aminomutase